MLIFRHIPLHTLQRTWGYAYVQISVSLRKWHFFNIYQGCACQIYLLVRCICTSNHMCKKEIWDKFTEFTFLKKKKKSPEWNERDFKISKMNEVNFPQISRINMWFLVNHMWQPLKEHTSVRITQKTINQYQQI